jgi:gluconate 2-dehydrogenase gamma chain
MADGATGGWDRGAALSDRRDVEHVFEYLTQPEVLFLDAAAARLIPADALGPGAKEAGVTRFIDGQLASSWGTHGRNYRMGPWQEGTPEQGYQSPLTPQELYRAAIRETNLQCVKQYGKPFSLLAAEQQDAVLHALESGEVDLESVGSNVFFGLLWRNTQEGFFADPLYGGNQDKIGWRLIGFPGVAAADYKEHMSQFNVPYRVEPVSILDIREGRVEVDAQGYPKHVMLVDKR